MKEQKEEVRIEINPYELLGRKEAMVIALQRQIQIMEQTISEAQVENDKLLEEIRKLNTKKKKKNG